MKKHLRSVFCLLAPSLALMALAFYFSRRAAVAPLRTTGPFQIGVTNVAEQEIKAVDVFEGYDRRMRLIFDVQGARPKVWGDSDGSRSGPSKVLTQTWKFWLEQDGKKTAMPFKAQAWTSGWDGKLKQYYNEFRVQSGSIPDAAVLKMSGTSQVEFSGVSPTPFISAPVPFEVTLKEAGQHWGKPQVAPSPGMIIRGIKIQKPNQGRTTALIKLMLTPGTEISSLSTQNLVFLDGNWNGSARKIPTNGRFSADPLPSKKSRRMMFRMTWNAQAIRNSLERDLIITMPCQAENYAPLEIAFPVKKDGQPIYGLVPALSRPRGK